MIMLRAERLTKQFVLHLQGGTRLPVLAGLEFAVHAGECLVLAGLSGAGKTTVLRSLYGTFRLNAGRVMVRHRDVMVDIGNRVDTDARLVMQVRRETVGYVSQFLRVVPRISALDIVAEAGVQAGMSTDEARQEAAALLNRLHIPPRLHNLPPATFSGGEQQRVNLARGFIGRHPVLLLDEPTASLDAARRAVVIGMIQEAKARGTAIVGIFHDAPVRDAVADTCLPIPVLQEAA